MKKALAMMFLIISIVLLSGCEPYLSDSEIVEANMQKVIDCLAEEDQICVRNLFAPNKIKGIENLNETIDELFLYYKGDYVSHKKLRSGRSKGVDYGKIEIEYTFTYAVTTNEGVYYMDFEWCTREDFDADNIGIWTFYIIDAKDYMDNYYFYFGDMLNTYGLNIGKQFPPSIDFDKRESCLGNYGVDFGKVLWWFDDEGYLVYGILFPSEHREFNGVAYTEEEIAQMNEKYSKMVEDGIEPSIKEAIINDHSDLCSV